MILNANAQHRVKHFDLLLERELALIKREHEQNLITQKNFENAIRRDSDRALNWNRKKISLQFEETSHEQSQTFDPLKTRIYSKDYSNDKPRSSISSNHSDQNQIDETVLRNPPKYRRLCTKLHRLPPIIKANMSNRRKQSINDLYWVTQFAQSNQRNENVHDTLAKINEESKHTILPELTPIQKQIQSFMETLPTYTGIQRGFDNFGPASLYSTRAPVIMK